MLALNHDAHTDAFFCCCYILCNYVVLRIYKVQLLSSQKQGTHRQISRLTFTTLDNLESSVSRKCMFFVMLDETSMQSESIQ